MMGRMIGVNLDNIQPDQNHFLFHPSSTYHGINVKTVKSVNVKMIKIDIYSASFYDGLASFIKIQLRILSQNSAGAGELCPKTL